jgi:hypothetical protein
LLLEVEVLSEQDFFHIFIVTLNTFFLCLKMFTTCAADQLEIRLAIARERRTVELANLGLRPYAGTLIGISIIGKSERLQQDRIFIFAACFCWLFHQ